MMNEDMPMPEDHPTEHPRPYEPTPHQKGFFDAIGSKNAYFLGVGSAIGIVFAAGFFILLSLYMKGVKIGDKGTTPPPVIAQPTDPSGAAPAQILLAAVTDQDHIRGNKNAKVTVVEFSDMECPFCKNFHQSMLQVVAAYGDKVAWVYRHFPLDSLHPKARKEAEASECAAELGGNDAFWKFMDKVFEVTPANNGLDPAELPKIAKLIGLDQGKFTTCLTSGKFASKIQSQADQGAAAGANGTPYSVIVVGDQKIPVNGAVPFAQLKSMLDSVVK